MNKENVKKNIVGIVECCKLLAQEDTKDGEIDIYVFRECMSDMILDRFVS